MSCPASTPGSAPVPSPTWNPVHLAFASNWNDSTRNPLFRGIRCGNLWGRNLADQISSPWQPRAQFPAGKFVAPHGACFDHEGNIFVVEWVEIGRVTKLRRLG